MNTKRHELLKRLRQFVSLCVHSWFNENNKSLTRSSGTFLFVDGFKRVFV